jgi:sugar phosphate isomerase/epimerase
MDIFWVVNAGKDPIQYFEKYPGRFEQWHVKDMDKSDRNRNADVGTGTIDYKPIFAKAKLSGMTNFYVEQESYPGAPIDSVEKSAKYMKTILYEFLFCLRKRPPSPVVFFCLRTSSH